jgi:NADH:ubiquinone oxidoreductase subunit 6 (subunit J)
LIIYVGAIAVLFVFVLMMVELKNVDTYPNFVHILVCAGIPFFSVIWFYPFFSFFFLQNPYTTIVLNSKFISLSNHFFDFYFEDDSTEILIIGQLLYTKYALHFLTSGLILTLAVISVGLLTIDYKKPFISIQELIVSRKI